MKRRRLLQGIASSSALSLTVGVAAGDDGSGGEVSELNLDEIEVRRGSEVVRTVSAPTAKEALRELENADRVLRLQVQQETGSDHTHVSERDISGLEVRRDGEVVRTVDDPSEDDVSRVLDETAEDERVVTSSGDCVICCSGDYCPCDACLIACSTCDCCCNCTGDCC